MFVLFSSLLLASKAIAGKATDPTLTCDGNLAPDWDACDQIAARFTQGSSVTEITDDPGTCPYITGPDGVDPDTLNCVIYLCLGDRTDIDYGAIAVDYDYAKAMCGPGHGSDAIQSYQPDYDYTLYVQRNENYNPPNKRSVNATERTHARDLGKRDGTCVDGTGTYKVLTTKTHMERDGDQQAVTGRLPAGSSYTIQDSDSKTFTVSTSVSVEAGFFELFDASASVSVEASDSVMTTTGVTVNVDCDDGQEGIIYIYPLYTEYVGVCESNNGAEIDVYDPEMTQNNYKVECLGSGS